MKWKGYRYEHNSWVPERDMAATDLVARFHRDHPNAPRCIQSSAFRSLAFKQLQWVSSASGMTHLKGGGDVRGPTASLIGVLSLSHITNSFPCESTSRVSIECTPRTTESFTFWTPDGVAAHSARPPPLAGEWVDGMATVGSELRFGGSRVVGRIGGSDPRESGL